MRPWKPLACLALAMLVATFAVAEPLPHAGSRGGPQAAGLDDAEILAEFHRIVEILWTDDEEDEWDRANTDDEKLAVIAAFWERRDPTPGTPDNEFRDIYMLRAGVAAQTFANEGTAGYRTDRGRVFMIYGGNALLAQETRRGGGEMSVAGGGGGEEISGGAANPRSREAFMYIWTMDATINPFLDGKEEIVFAPFQDTWPLSTRGVELSAEAFLANRDVQELIAARRVNPEAAMTGAGTGPATDMPPDVAALQALLDDGTERNDLGLQQDFRFFPAPEGNTYAVIAFEVGKEGLTFTPDNVKAFGQVLREDPIEGEVPVHQIDAAFTVGENDGDATDSGTHSFAVTLAPGAHRLAWGVMDTAGRRITTVSRAFEVPSYIVDELTLTSVAVANRPFSQTQEPIDLNTIYDVMRIGPFEIAIDIDRVYGRNESLSLLYFVMGTGVDDAGQPQLEVTHRVLMAEEDTSIAVLPAQTLAASAISQVIPLAQIGQLEAGSDYRIQISIKDLTNDAELIHEVPFSVAPAGQ